MSVWLDSSGNSNKFKQSYFRDFVDVSGEVLIRNGLSLKLYNSNVPTRVQFSINSNEFRIYNDTDHTYYDISNTKLLYLQDLSENVQAKLNQVNAVQSALNLKASTSTVDASFASVASAIATKASTTIVDASFASVTSAIATKASSSVVDASFVSVNSAIATKATTTIVDASFASVNNAIALKAGLASPALTGVPTAPTATAGTNTTQIATTAFVKTAVDNLVANAPAALDTLNELAAALGSDASFSTTITNSLASKAPLANPTFTGTVNASKVVISSDASFNGRVDICGNFYAKYPASSIPSSAIIGGVPTNSVDTTTAQTISGVKTFTNGLNVGSILVSSVAGNPSFQRVQIGQDIEEGGDNSAYFGQSVSMNSDGSIVAIGANYTNGLVGRVCVYRKVGSTWTRIGQIIAGEASGDQSGFSVSLSSDGYTVAIGAPYNDGNGSDSGQVRVYKYNGSTTWTKLGQDIDGEALTNWSGYSVSLSADGTIVAIGAPYNTTSKGQVRVYQYNGSTTWTQIGQDIDGEASPDNSAWSVSLSSDGTIVAIGAPYNDGTASNAGHVRVYQYNGSSTWTQIGQDIDGQTADDYFGKSVSLSSDGTILAVGAPEYDGTGFIYDCGRVRVYKYNGSTWAQLGQNIDGEAQNDNLGRSVSLSADGTILAIGANLNDGTGANAGHVRIYQYSGTTWSQLGSDIDGEAAGDQSGLSVSLSKDGAFVAIGAIFNDNVVGTDSGHVRVYQIRDLTVSKLTINNNVDICGNLYAQYAAASIPASAINGISTSIQTALNLKATQSIVDASFTSVNSAIALKATQSIVDASFTSVNSAIALKATKTIVDASFTSVNSAIALKATTTIVDASFTSVNSAIALKADLASPTLTGVPSAPTATAGTNTTQLATTAFVTTAASTKANLASPALTGVPTAPTATAGTNTTQLATTAFVKSAVDNLVASAPAALDTLNELAAALGNDAAFSTTVTNSIASKAPLANPTFTGTVTASKVAISSDASFSGRVDVCGNFYANYPDSSIPQSAIVGGISSAAIVDLTSSQTISGVKTFSTQLNIGTNTLTPLAILAVSQMGSNLVGRTVVVQAGASVALNDAGTIIAIGCPNDYMYGNYSGSVRVYQWSGSAWSQLGADIMGTRENNTLGYSVSLSSSGLILAIGGPNISTTRVYQYVSNAWTQLGADIVGTGGAGSSVSISADGMTVAIGAPQANASSGQTRVYKYISSAWTQLGQDIASEAAGDWSGYSVALSTDGTTVVIGANYNMGANGYMSGHARVYKYANSTWTQIGQDLDGEVAYDMSGWSVAISDDGTIVAIGAPRNTTGVTTYNGQVRVYKYANSTWTKLGQDIDGRAIWALSGTTVSLSADGYTVAIGADSATGLGSEANQGYAAVYKYDGTIWKQLGTYLEGQAANDHFGTSVALSADGSTLASGAPFANSNDGYVKVYKIQNASSKIIVSNGFDICGNLYAQYPANSIPVTAISASLATLTYVDTALNAKAPLAAPTFTGTVVSSGDLAVNSKLRVSGDASFNGRVDICGNFYAQYPASSIPASAIAASLTTATYVDSSLNLKAPKAAPTFTGTVVSSGDLSLNSKLRVSGDASFNGRVDICGNFYAQYPASSIPVSAIATGLAPLAAPTFTGTVVSSGDLSINSKLRVSGDASFNGRVDICGNFYAKYPASSIPASAIVGVSDTLTVTNINISGNVGIGTTTPQAPLQVVGNSKIGSLSLTTISAQTGLVYDASWSQVGNTIQGMWWDLSGTLYASYAGWSTSLNGDGTIMAHGSSSNYVNIYKYRTITLAEWNLVSTTNRTMPVAKYPETVYDSTKKYWIQMGNSIVDFVGIDDHYDAVSLNEAGDTIVIGGSWDDTSGNNVGTCKVFKYDSAADAWNQVGQNIYGIVANEYFGGVVDINAAGNIIAAGGQLYNSYAGRVVVYKYDSAANQWNQIGQAFTGGKVGASLSLSSDGYTIAIAHADTMVAEVYTYSVGTNLFVQNGGSIVSEVGGDRNASSVSLNSDGTMLAVGASWATSQVGQVRVYEYRLVTAEEWAEVSTTLRSGVVVKNGDTTRNATKNYWVQVGNDVNGATGTTARTGIGVSLRKHSVHGTTLAVQGTTNVKLYKYRQITQSEWNATTTATYSSGVMKGNDTVYSSTKSYWIQLGYDSLPIAAGATSVACDLNSDGTVLVFGSPNSTNYLNKAVAGLIYIFSTPYVATNYQNDSIIDTLDNNARRNLVLNNTLSIDPSGVTTIAGRIDICGNLYAKYPDASIPASAINGVSSNVQTALNLKSDITYVDASLNLKANKSAVDASLNLKANLVSPIFTGPFVVASGDVSMNNNLSLGGDLIVKGNLSVFRQETNSIINTTINNYEIIITKDISLNGNLAISNNASLNSKLFVVGDVSLNNKLFVNGNATLNSKLSVANDASFNGRVDICGNLYAQYPNSSIPVSAITDGVSRSYVDASLNLKSDRTYVDASLNLKSNLTYVDNALNLKSNLTYVDASLNLKSDITYVDNALNLKSNLTYVDASLNVKPSFSQVDTSLNLKSNLTYVDASLNLKSNLTYVDASLNLKANQTYVDASLNLKANQTYVDASLNLKSNLTYVDASLNLKANQTYVDTALNLKANLASPTFTGIPNAPTASYDNSSNQVATTGFVQGRISAIINSAPAALDTLNELAAALGNDANFAATVTNSLSQKANITDVNSSLALKSNLTYVDASLNLKSDITYVDSALNLKSTLTYVDASLNVKPSFSQVDASLNLKSNVTYVDASLNLKSNITYVDASLNLKSNLTYVDASLNLKSNLTYVDASLNLKSAVTYVDTALNLKANLASPTFTGIPNAPTAAYDNSSNQLATTGFVQGRISAIINSAPAALDTLNELAAALGNDANYAATVTNSLSQKANITDVNAALALKATTTIVDASLNLKANATDVNSALALKATIASVDASLNLKSNITYVDASLNLKANATYVDASLNLKANATDVNSALALKATIASVDASLNLKSNITYVDASLNLKANATDVNSALALKAPIASVDASLNLKSNLTYVDASLNLKSNATYVDASLNLKANATDVNSALALKAPIASVDASLNLKSNLTYVDASLNLKSAVTYVDTSLNLKANLASPTFTGTPNAPTASYDNSSNQIATTGFVQGRISSIINSAPAALDTLNELAAALGNDANYAATVTNSLSQKANITDVNAALALKATTTIVDASLNLKANSTDMNSALALKATTTIVDASLNLKSNLTYVDASLNLKSNATDVNSALALKAPIASVDASLNLKSNLTYVDASLNLKSNLTYVDASLNVKPSFSQVDASLILKANLASPTFTGTPNAPTAAYDNSSNQIATTGFVQGRISAIINSAPAALDTLNELAAALGNDANYAATVTNSLSQKANITDVNSALALKATITAVDASLNLKANATDVNSALALKATIASVDASLNLKSNLTYVDASLNLKANATDVNSALALKAPIASVDASLNLKANATDVNSALALKATIASVDASLNLKSNLTYVDASLNLKSNLTYVDAALNLKSNLTYVDASLNVKPSFSQVDASLNLKSAVTYVDASLNLKATLASPTFTGTPNAPTASYDNSSNQIATTGFVQGRISSIINSAPAALDTLNELAAALGNDANYAATVTNLLSQKANTTDVNAALALKPTIAAVDASLNLKSNITYVDASLNLKSAVTYVDASLNAKPSFSQVDASLNAKPSFLQVDASLNLKSNVSYVDASLNAKPSFSQVDSSLNAKPSFSQVDASLNLKSNVSYVDSSLNLKANLVSPTFTGTPNAPTAAYDNSSNQIATTGFVQGRISAIINSAPAALDTLNELAAALGNDANYAATVTNSLSQKANTTDVNAALALKATITAVDASLNLKSNVTYVDSALTAKPNFLQVDASLNLKSDRTYVDASLNLKSNVTYVDAALTAKPNFSQVDASLNLKSAVTYVDASLNLKSAVTYVDASLNVKPSFSQVDASLNLKANLVSPAFTGTPNAPTATYDNSSNQIATTGFVQGRISAIINSAPAALDTLNELAAALGNDANFAATVTNSLSQKANTTDVNTALALKPSFSQVDASLNLKSNITYVDAALTAKPSFSQVDASLNLKSNITYVDASLNLKSNVTYVDAALTAKPNFSQVDVSLNLKSNVTYVDASLNLKSNITYVDYALTAKPNFSQVDASLNLKSAVTYVDASLNLKATLASPTFTGTPNAPTALYDNSSNQIATTGFVQGRISSIINSAPAALDTLNELAAALGNDANFAATVTNSLSQKANITDVNTSLALKPNFSQVDASLNLKSNITYVDAALAVKPSFSQVDVSLNAKPSFSQVDASLNLKSNLTYVDASLNLKSNVTYVDAALTAKPSFSQVDASLNLKSNLTYVDASLNLKSNVTYVDAALTAKPSFSQVDVSLNAKPSFSQVDASLNLKSDRTYVDSSLNTKPSFSQVDSSLNLKANSISPTFTGIVTAAKLISGDASFNGNLDISGVLSVTQTVNSVVKNTTINNYNVSVTNDLSLNGKLVVSSDVSLNSKLYVKGDASFGRVDICGNFYAQYPNNSIPSSAISNGVTLSYVDASLNLKSAVTYVDSSLNLKPSFSQVDASLNLKSNITYVDAALTAKPSFSQVDASLNLKSNLTYVDASLNLKSNLTYVDASLNLKSNLTYVDASLNLKSNLTYVDASLNLKSNLTYVDSVLNAKPNFSQVDVSLNLKSNVTYVDTSLNLKSNITYVDAALTTKPNFSQVDVSLNLKSNVTYVDSSLNLKANLVSPTFTGIPNAPTAAYDNSSNQIATTGFVQGRISAIINSAPAALDTLNELAAALGNDANYAATVTNSLSQKANITDVNTALALKPSFSQVDASLNLKPSFSQIDASLNLKPNFSQVDASLNLKPSFAQVDVSLNAKPSFLQVDASLNLKPSFAQVDVSLNAKPSFLQVDASLNLKSAVTYVDASLNLKSTVTYVDASLNLKPSFSQVDVSLILKPSFSQVDASLNLKSAVTYVDASLNLKPSFSQVDASLNLKSAVIYVDASLNLKANLASPTFTGTPNAPTAAYDNSSNQIATTGFVQGRISAIINSAPAALDTLNELAAALGNDANYAATVTNSLSQKANITDVNTSLALKPSFSQVDASLNLKSAITYVDASLNMKPSFSQVDASLNLKPTFAQVDSSLNLKPSFSQVDASLNLKPSFSQVDASLNLKSAVTYVDASLNLKSAVTYVDASLNLKPSFSQIDASLNLKPSFSQVDASLNLKSTITYVDSSLNLKANLASPTFTGTPNAPTASYDNSSNQIATTGFVQGRISAIINSAPAALDTLNELAAALGNDANFAATVTNSLSQKANATDVNSALALKPSFSQVDASLNLKPSFSQIDASLNLKPNFSQVDASLNLKSAVTYVDASLNLKSAVTYVDASLNLKSAVTYVDASLNLKSSVTYVNASLNLKPSFSQVDASLNLKPSFAQVDASLNAILNFSQVDASLNLKPSFSQVDASLNLKSSVTYVDASLNLKSAVTYVDASLNLKAALASPTFTGIPNAPTAAYDNSSNQIATTGFVQGRISSIINSAPAALDTLNELAAALGNDANFAATVTNSLSQKANTTDLNAALALKPSFSQVDASLNLKPTFAQVDASLNAILNIASVDASLNLKSNLTYVDASLNLKSNLTYVDASLNMKPRFAQVDVSLNLKPSFVQVDASLNLKPSFSQVDASLNLKPSFVQVDASLNLKPSFSQVDASLNLKANVASPTFTGIVTAAKLTSGDASFNGNIDISGVLSVTQTVNSVVKNTTINNYNVAVTNDLSLNGKLIVSSDVSLNSKLFVKGDASFNGRVDICGNFYANYPANSIPSSAIIGGVSGGSTSGVDISSNQTISGVKTFTNGIDINNTSLRSVIGIFDPSFQRVQIGQDIDGEAAGDQSGFSVSINSDGTVVAIGAINNDGTTGTAADNRGSVRVYKNISGTWTKLGQDIDGEAAGDNSGFSVSLSADGTIVAIGANFNDGGGADSGQVRVYKYDGSTTWTKLGQDIDGEATLDQSGYSVSLSSDGTIVAIGALYNNGVNGSASGHVRIYKYNGSTAWTKLGQDIDGEAIDDGSGYSVSLSSDGTIVAIGAPYNDGNGNLAGQVRVYQYNGTTTWTQIGQDIDGEYGPSFFGWSVSLSSDGTVVAIGAIANDGTTGDGADNRGSVRVYKNISGTWTKLGQDIDGEATGDNSGMSVSLSGDGTIVAIGAPRNVAGTFAGHVRIYQYITSTSTWLQLGSDIDGEATSDQSGYYVSLSKDSTMLAVGAPFNDGTPVGADRGHVRVYKIRNASLSKLSVNNNVDICGNFYAQYPAASIPASAINGISTVIQTAIDLKSNIASPALTGVPTAPTATAGTNTTQLATTAFVTTAVSTKADLASPALTGVPTAPTATAGTNTTQLATTAFVTTAVSTKADLASPTFTGNVVASKMRVTSDASFNGRVDICGNFYAQYPASSIPSSAIIGGVGGGGGGGSSATDISINSLSVGRGGGNNICNTVLGVSAGAALPVDSANNTTAIGAYALSVNNVVGGNNTAIGFNALKSHIGGFCTAVGGGTLQNNTTGYMNVGVGSGPLTANTTGSYNVAMNWGALGSNTIGNDNVAIGKQALSANQTGSNNIGIGTLAMQGTTSSSNNTAVGYRALVYSSSGNSNTAYGYLAGQNNSSGSFNTYIGYGADLPAYGATWSNSTAIGANAMITASNQITLGTAAERVFMPGKLTAVGDASFNGRVDICGNLYANYPAGSIPSSAITGGVLDLTSSQTISGTKTFSTQLNIGTNAITQLATLAVAQIGTNLLGRAAGLGGSSTALNDAGTIVAIGSPSDNNFRGSVRIYQWSGTAWTQLGSDILGTADNTQLGCAVSLSSSGFTIAIGGFARDLVRVYQYASNVWTQVGADIVGTGQAGSSVSISADGLTVAIGAPHAYVNGGQDRGQTRVYKYISNSWTQLGQDLIGEDASNWSGCSVALSADGTTVVIGANYNNGVINGTTAYMSGHARVYKYANSTWTQLGQDIDGEVAYDMSGWSVAISDDGTIVAIGAPRNTTGATTYNGHARIYKYANSTWTKLGQDIDGRAIWAQSGSTISLSADGYTVAIGAGSANGLGGEASQGYAVVYKYNGTTWSIVGSYIEGQAAQDQFGFSLSLSSDGTILSVGAPYNNSSTGYVKVYKIQTASSKIIVSDGLDICGNLYAKQLQLSSSATFNGRVDICGNFYAQYPPNSIPASAIIGGVGSSSGSSGSSGSSTGANVTFTDSFALIKEAVVVDPASTLLRQF